MNKVVDDNDFNEIFSTLTSAERENHVVINYRLTCKDLTPKESAALLAINTSLGTLRKLPYEKYDDRSKVSAKVLSVAGDGSVQIAYPVSLCEPKAGLASLLSVLWYSSEYNYTAGFRVEHIDFPSKYLSYFKGPEFGITGIRDKLGVNGRPILGAIVKPRRGISLDIICAKCSEAYLGGVDFISDDELTIDPDGEFSFESRVSRLSDVARKSSEETGEKKWFIANITSSPRRAIAYALKAKEIGVDALLVNAFTMGFSVLEDLSSDSQIQMPIMTCNMGTAIVTRPVQYTGVSEVVISALSRIAGADAVNSGIVGSVWYNSEAEHQSLSNLRKPLGSLKPSFPIVAGGLTLANLLPNLHDHGIDVMLQSGGGILGFPSGPRKGASAFRKIVDGFRVEMSRTESERMLIELGKKDKSVKAALSMYGFKPIYSS